MLSQSLVTALNKQVNAEFLASSLYLQMSAWCTYKGLPGCAAFLKQQADEERQHMHKLFTYVAETGALALVGQIAAPATEYASIQEVFEKTYQHECDVTKSIFKLMESALAEKDYSTANFLQWYVAEQHEEESLFKSILDKLRIIGSDGRGLFFIDKEIGDMARARAGA